MNNCEKYESEFNIKIDNFKNHSKYEWLRKYANEALKYHTEYGFYAIKAQDFMNRIIKMPSSYIQLWLDGKNNLEWNNYNK